MITEQIAGTTPGGTPKGAATSGGLRSIGRMAELLWTSPLAVIRVQEQTAAHYLHLLFALAEERLWAIMSFFPSTLLFVLRDLQARAPELLRDLADGAIHPDLGLPTGLRHALEQRLGRHPQRARALAALYEQDRFTVRDIWPLAGAIFTAGSGSFRLYVEQLHPFQGGIPVCSPIYAASEAAIGIGLSPGQPGYVLSPGSAYVEFVPPQEAERPGAQPLALHQVEPDREYEFVQRQGQVINVVGEKTGEAQIGEAFAAACLPPLPPRHPRRVGRGLIPGRSPPPGPTAVQNFAAGKPTAGGEECELMNGCSFTGRG